jgi:hypothetical protein
MFDSPIIPTQSEENLKMVWDISAGSGAIGSLAVALVVEGNCCARNCCEIFLHNHGEKQRPEIFFRLS